MAQQLYKTDLKIPDTGKICEGDFLQALKLEIPQFAQYDSTSLWFTVPQEEIQEQYDNFIQSFTCEKNREFILNSLRISPNWVMKASDPTISENPVSTDIGWINTKTGETYICVNNTEDQNVWVGIKSGRLIRPIPPADKFDFFDDSSCILFSKLNGDAKDEGGLYHGVDTGIRWEPLFDHKVANSYKSGTIKFKNLPINENTEAVTIASWIQWNGQNGVMPYGFNRYDMYCYGGYIGFNTAQGDVHGFSFKEYKKKWVYMISVFKKGQLGRIILNGQEMTLDYNRGNFSTSTSVVSSELSVFGWNSSSGYRRFGKQGRLRLFNRELTLEECQVLTQTEVSLIRSIGGEV